MKKLFIIAALLSTIFDAGYAQTTNIDLSFINNFPQEYYIDYDGMVRLYPHSILLPLVGGKFAIPYEGIKDTNLTNIKNRTCQRITNAFGGRIEALDISGLDELNPSASKGYIYLESWWPIVSKYYLTSAKNTLDICYTGCTQYPTQMHELTLKNDYPSGFNVRFGTEDTGLPFTLYFTDDLSKPFNKWHAISVFDWNSPMPITLPEDFYEQKYIFSPYKGYYILVYDYFYIASNMLEIKSGRPFPEPKEPEKPEEWPEDRPIVINNWVKTTTYTQPDAQSSIQNIVYYDGSGRPVQNIQIQGSAGDNRKNIVSPIYYDSLGRDNARTYLPYVSPNSSASMDSDPFAAQRSYYSAKYSADEAAYAYTENVFDRSPLNRIEKTYNVGTAYRNADKYAGYGYHTNTSSEVFLLTVNPSDHALNVSTYYSAGTLYKSTLTNEDGQTVSTFTDLLGRTILERLIGDDGVMLDTYYGYDARGRICWVVSPEGAKELRQGRTIPVSDTMIADKYCYIYKYDGLDRVVEKKLPGRGWEYMVYDKGGRIVIVLLQDGKMRLSEDGTERTHKQWLYNVYDDLGRLSDQSLVRTTTAISRENIQAHYDNVTFNNTYTALAATGRLNVPLLNDFVCTAILSQSRYGGYNYAAGGNPSGPSENTTLSFMAVESVAQNADLDNRTDGLLIYEKKAVLAGTGGGGQSFIENRYYYDSNGRVIQIVERNHLGGISRYSTKYDFLGNVLIQHESHQISIASTPDVIVRKFTYDHGNRLLSETTNLNGGAAATIAYTYNELGQLVGKTYGGSLTDSLQYNIQGWLTGQSNSLFDMNLRYYDSQLGTTPSYAGNITEWGWQHKNMQQPKNTYAFSYDKLGRLIDAGHYEGTVKSDRFREQIFGYDLNGNIGMIDRSTDTGLETYLNDYEGNRLSKVTTVGGEYVYTYDANGNCTHDGLNNLDLKYNYLNLIAEVGQGAASKAKYTWLADGTKLGVVGVDGRGYEYLGSLIYVRNGAALALESAGFGAGRIVRSEGTGGDTYTANYFITDHLGSVRAVVAGGQRVQTSDYYPFGLRWENTASMYSDNRFLYNGKESQSSLGVNYLDYGARMYDARLGRWFNIDPMAEKYYPFNPYNYCLNNPIIYIDPNGMDVWEIDNYGYIVNHFTDITQDIFYMMDKDENGNYYRTYTMDAGGNKIYNSISFEYGTIKSQKSYSFSVDGKIGYYDVYKVRGDNNGTALFKFMADNITGSSTQVEIGQTMTGIEGDEGLNFITTSHQERKEKGMVELYQKQLYAGYTIREITHSHPNNAYPSGLDERDHDIGFSGVVTYTQKINRLAVPLFYIYHVPKKAKIQYTPNSISANFK